MRSPSVRKWLTYMALVIAAGVLVGDLITALTYLLRGVITSRFLAEAFVVLVISGGVLFYYFGGLRRSESPEIKAGRRRDAWMAGVSAIAVIAMIIAGFVSIGPPRTQRIMRADNRRIQDLYQLSMRINGAWNANTHQLPTHLDQLTDVPLVDPISRATYEYAVVEGDKYQLCATFVLSTVQNQANSRSTTWSHPAGRYCFVLDASRVPDSPNIYLGD